MMAMQVKGGREKLGILLPPDLAKELRIEKVESGDEISEIIEEAVRVRLPERRRHRQKQSA